MMKAMGRTKSILIVEDETDLAELIRFNLEKEGYTCRCAADGVETLRAIREFQPDLLILDEATSELDVAAERRFQQTLSDLHGQTAMLIVAHRLSTVLGVDKVHVLDDGEVADGS